MLSLIGAALALLSSLSWGNGGGGGLLIRGSNDAAVQLTSLAVVVSRFLNMAKVASITFFVANIQGSPKSS